MISMILFSPFSFLSNICIKKGVCGGLKSLVCGCVDSDEVCVFFTLHHEQHTMIVWLTIAAKLSTTSILVAGETAYRDSISVCNT